MDRKPRRIVLKTGSAGYNRVRPGDPEYCEAATKEPRNRKSKRHRYKWETKGQKRTGTCKLCGQVVEQVHCTKCEIRLKHGELGPECDWCKAGNPCEIDAEGARRLIRVLAARTARDLVVSVGRSSRGYNLSNAEWLAEYFNMPVKWVLEKVGEFKETGDYGY